MVDAALEQRENGLDMGRRWIPWLIAGLAIAIAGGGLALVPWMPADERGDQIFARGLALIILATAAAVGALIAIQRPANPVGWLLSAATLLVAVSLGADAYTQVEPVLAARGWVAWAGGLTIFPGIVCVPLALLVFPDGRLLSRRWRLAVGLDVVAAATLTLTAALSSPLLGYSEIDNPTGSRLSFDGGPGWPLTQGHRADARPPRRRQLTRLGAGYHTASRWASTQPAKA